MNKDMYIIKATHDQTIQVGLTTRKSATDLRTPDFPGELSRINSELMSQFSRSLFIWKHSPNHI